MTSPRTQISRTAPTQFLELKGGERYAYRRFGSGSGLPLLLLQLFTGTLDNWDPALTDGLAGERELVLFDNAGVGRSSGAVPTTVGGMAKHAATFLDGLGVETCDVLGFRLAAWSPSRWCSTVQPSFGG
jgi:pimeloyl-ACP methyl ester carboxylesterase